MKLLQVKLFYMDCTNEVKETLLPMNLTSKMTFQKVFYQKVFLEIRKIHSKKPVPESFFNNVAGLRLERA